MSIIVLVSYIDNNKEKEMISVKKGYVLASIEVVLIEEDVITSSETGGGYDELPDQEPED